MLDRIQYIDFKPEVIDKSFWKGNNYEHLDRVMERVNDWIRKNHNNEIINVETIQLVDNKLQKKNDPSSRINAGGSYIYMLQVIRVWYK
jgi:hypothetical protein